MHSTDCENIIKDKILISRFSTYTPGSTCKDLKFKSSNSNGDSHMISGKVCTTLNLGRRLE